MSYNCANALKFALRTQKSTHNGTTHRSNYVFSTERVASRSPPTQLRKALWRTNFRLFIMLVGTHKNLLQWLKLLCGVVQSAYEHFKSTGFSGSHFEKSILPSNMAPNSVYPITKLAFWGTKLDGGHGSLANAQTSLNSNGEFKTQPANEIWCYSSIKLCLPHRTSGLEEPSHPIKEDALEDRCSSFRHVSWES